MKKIWGTVHLGESQSLFQDNNKHLTHKVSSNVLIGTQMEILFILLQNGKPVEG
jgi:hypothetical protein